MFEGKRYFLCIIGVLLFHAVTTFNGSEKYVLKVLLLQLEGKNFRKIYFQNFNAKIE